MRHISLNGQWMLNRKGSSEEIRAKVPGCVHMDLLEAGIIPDPFYRDNEKELMWIGETDWEYRRQFFVEKEILDYERIILRCHGLDTMATIIVNGRQVGTANNMYRIWEYDLKPVLQEGENSIIIQFPAVMPYLRDRDEEFYLPAWGVGEYKVNSGGWIRKQPSNFGWDWGPMLVTCGIWRDIEIIAYNKGRISDISILQDHSEEGAVILDIVNFVETTGKHAFKGKVELEFEGEILLEEEGSFEEGQLRYRLKVDNPRLWWPNGMGEQPLYTLKLYLFDEQGKELDRQSKRIGLRTLELVLEEDQWGQSFKFAVNGVQFFAKGANWIPADTFVARLQAEDYYSLLKDAADANMNMIRVWGGGIYEDDVFYDICDELGLCVWQDFMFACSTYPAFDEDFLENVRYEAIDNIKRIRHHACLALWCGNNELEQGIVADKWDTERIQMSWADYSRLFDKLLPGLVKEYSPQTAYWPGSPHSPLGDRVDSNNPDWGDAHLWEVWHGRKPFEWYRTCKHRFVSEFGFQSFPEPATVYSYTEPEDRNISSYIMEEHQRSPIGNTTIIHYMLDWFRLPGKFEDLLWTSQVLQGLAIKYAVEHWRRSMPRTMGTLYWQLNDCWPVASWSSIDYYGRWKALHYMARRFYAPLLISGLEDGEGSTVEIHVTSDKLKPVTGEVIWKLTDVSGKMIKTGQREIEIPASSNTLVETLYLGEYVAEYGSRNLLLWLELKVDGETVSDNLVAFKKPKHMELQEPGISYQVEKITDNCFRVFLEAEKPALWTWLELKDYRARYSDNFFHLYPGKKQAVLVETEENLSVAVLKENLVIRSLIDTY